MIYIFFNFVTQKTTERKNSDHRSRADILTKLITKLSVLVTLATISTWLLYALVLPFLPGVVVVLEAFVNTICAIFCYKSYEKSYKRTCYVNLSVNKSFKMK